MVIVISLCRQEWLWHVVRMDGEMTVKQLQEGKSGGGRNKTGTVCIM